MIDIKHGVKLDKLQPQMLLVLINVERLWWLHGLSPTLTSGNDGKHRTNSLHYQGHAIDLRTRDITETRALFFRDRLKESLGENYDVVLEFDPPHLHIEYDPKE